jgi:hypothetical protein
MVSRKYSDQQSKQLHIKIKNDTVQQRVKRLEHNKSGQPDWLVLPILINVSDLQALPTSCSSSVLADRYCDQMAKLCNCLVTKSDAIWTKLWEKVLVNWYVLSLWWFSVV